MHIKRKQHKLLERKLTLWKKIEDFFNFLDEVCNKYKDIILDDDTPAATTREMCNEIYDYMYTNVKKIDALSCNQISSIRRYAVELGSKFKDPNLGRSFWYSGVCFSFGSLPMDK